MFAKYSVPYFIRFTFVSRLGINDTFVSRKHEKNNIYDTKEFLSICRKMAVLSAASTVACNYAAHPYEQKIDKKSK